ncbi:MAG: nucleotidyltransferase [Desulfobacteraceae bacterium]|nr:nucleotidyltransferase [Desulfobacteraceae bacterium]
MPEIKLLENALGDIAALFEKHRIEYMVIGGLANAKWGQPRATLDIDITLWVSDSEIKNLISLLKGSYTLLVDKPFEFIRDTRVLPLKDHQNQRIDLIFGALPFERQAIERSLKVEIGNTAVNFCTPEDLILLKIISDRPRDLEDVQGILRFRKETLDYNYLEPRIQDLANLLDRPDILSQWERWNQKSL